jgi:chromosomal replication initiator protein
MNRIDPKVEAVLRAVSAAYSVTVEDVLGISREQPLPEARMVAMFVMRRTTDMTYEQIGNVFGQRANSAYISCRKIGVWASIYPALRHRVLDLQGGLNERFRREGGAT